MAPQRATARLVVVESKFLSLQHRTLVATLASSYLTGFAVDVRAQITRHAGMAKAAYNTFRLRLEVADSPAGKYVLHGRDAAFSEAMTPVSFR